MRPRSSSLAAQCAALEAKCAQLGIMVIYDDLRGEGGVCRLRSDIVAIINRRASLPTRIRILTEALNKIPQLTTKS